MSVSEGLGPEARALLDAAREGLSPDAAAVRRVHARVHAVVAGGAAAGAAGNALGIKLGAVAVIAAIAVGAVVVARRSAAPSPAPVPVIELASPVERPQQVAVHEVAPPAAPAVDDSLITIEPATDSTTGPASGSKLAPSPRRSASPSTHVVAPAAPAAHASSSAPTASRAAPETARRTGPKMEGPGFTPGINLSREVELVDLAMAALRRGDADAALRTVAEYAVEAAGAGQLTQDAAAIEIEALCQLHDPSARDKLAAFDAKFPRSAQRARLAGACK
jgi:hypothetical protein